MLAVPCAGMVTLATDSVPPSASLSFARTAIVAAVSSAVVAASSFATGASLTLVIVTLTVAVAVPPWPSVTV